MRSLFLVFTIFFFFSMAASPVREQNSLTAWADNDFKSPLALNSNDPRLKSAAFSNGVNGQENKPFIGEITSDRVNVRAGPDLNFEIIYSLDKGQKIEVKEEQFGWYRIQLPEECVLYINKEFVSKDADNYLAKAEGVNVRSGAGFEFNVVGQLSKGSKIEVIREELKWYGIKATPDCSGWVNSKYIRFYETMEKYKLDLARKEAAGKNYSKILSNYTRELKQNISDMKLEPIRADFERFLVDYPDTPQAKLAQEKIDEINLKLLEIEHLKTRESLKEARQEFREAKRLIDEKISLIDNIAQIKTNVRKDPPAYVGTIEDVGILWNRPARHKLCNENKEILCYLASEKIDLNRFIYRKVRLWGKAEPLPNSEKKLLRVSYLEEMD